MDLRDSKSRLILIIIGLGAALVIAVASCGGSGGDNDGADNSTSGAETPEDDGKANDGSGADDRTAPAEGDESPILAEISDGGTVSLTVNSAVREEGGFLTVTGTLTNQSSENFFDRRWRGEENELANNGFSMAGAAVTDKIEGKRHLILRDTSGRCLCTQFGSDGIDPGETVSWFAQFPAPAESTSEVDFQVADLPPATIDISQR